MKPTACPSRDELSAYLLGKLPDDASQRVAAHSGQCPSCQKALAMLDSVSDPLLVQLRQPRGNTTELSNLGPALKKAAAVGAKALLAGGPLTQADANTSPPDNTLAPRDNSSQEVTAMLAPSQGPGEIGRLGSYSVLKVLGQGGMGVVFQAEDPQLKRPVALKAMLPDVAARASARERFLREARAAAAIEHDHIVTIYQVGEDRGVPFLAMQFLKGMSLEDFLKKQKAANKPLTWGQILKLGREIAKGLAAAHERGLIHRDIKPANIWLDAAAGGRVKILDFGLARGAEDAQLTQSGMIVGTAAYMAPEQAKSLKVDGRADLYSLGCVLYRLCTGRTPFIGPDAMAVLIAAATEEPPPVLEVNKDVPPDLAALTMKLLAKKPEDRPRSAADVVKAIAAIEKKLAPRKDDGDETAAQARVTAAPGIERRTATASVTQPQVELPRRDRKRWAVAAAAVMTLGAAAALAFVVLRQDDAGQARVSSPAESGKVTAPAVAVALPVQEVDLLKHIDGVKNAPHWRFQNQVLLTPPHGSNKGIQVSYAPPAEYELEIEATRMNAKDTLILGLVGGGRPFHLVLDGYKGTTSRLAYLDGKTDENETTYRGSLFTNEKLFRVTVRVTRAGVTVHSDGKKIIDWQGDFQRLTADPRWTAPNPEQLALCTIVSAFQIQKFVLRPLSGASTSPALDPWARSVQKLPPEEQVKAVAAKLQELNPGFDGKVRHSVKQNQVRWLNVAGERVADVSPLRALSGLEDLDLGPSPGTEGQVAGLAALRGLPLRTLVLGKNPKCGDLTPLQGMPLTKLNCPACGVRDLGPLQGMPLTDLWISSNPIADLSPLRGMPLQRLTAHSTSVADLKPLAGMPLEILDFVGCPVTDIAPLAGMPLVHLTCSDSVTDLSPLRGSRLQSLRGGKPERHLEALRSVWTLTEIGRAPAIDFWKQHDPKHAAFLQWIEDTKKLSAQEQVKAVATKLKERNPGFDGEVTHEVKNDTVTQLKFTANDVSDLSPVRALVGLQHLHCRASGPGKGKLSDLSPLTGMKLKHLTCGCARVSDLSPLKGMPLVHFNCDWTKELKDISPLREMPLVYLNCSPTGVTDLAPIKNMPLVELWCDFNPARDAAILKSIKTLERINRMPAAEFWKDVDAKKP
ncbi:MAG: protein kinase [Gemmataceae bacterium]|nr:protein kinase [Gemmataceae bacterium]